ncbi:MAG: hypothetical protein HY718_12840 [Planctomycetes bacterium]|nr:hypothetical protein [Planctomycetota bacterium]
MRRRTIAACLVAWFAAATSGQTLIIYTLELGGDNRTELWEAGLRPAFTSGVTDGTTTTCQGMDVTWAVRVSVGGVHVDPGGPGDGKAPLGAAELAFDIQLYEADGTTPIVLDAAPLSCEVGTAGVAGARGCRPTDKGYHSSINDGDGDGSRGQNGAIIDCLANAAFAFGLVPSGGEASRLIDPVPGPYFDYGWYPTANGRSGTDLTCTVPVSTTVTGLSGLIGFHARYAEYDYTRHSPGVGQDWVGGAVGGAQGFGVDRPLFEGQINTSGLVPGYYVLKVIPDPARNQVLHGDVVWDSPTPDYGGWSTFAVAANEVTVMSAGRFEIAPPGGCGYPGMIVACKLFYNQSFYDGNKIGIDPAPISGANNDDADAIDNGGPVPARGMPYIVYPAKIPLMPGGGQATLANWTGYDKGINGLTYDIQWPIRPPQASDFVFHNIGKAGTVVPGPGNVVTPMAFATQSLGGSPPVTRVLMTFTGLTNTWLQVDIGTGFGWGTGTHWWGNAAGDTGQGNTAPNVLVNATDEIWSRRHPTTPLNRSPVQDMADVNKDALVNATDQIYVRTHPTTPLNCVKMITR